MAKEGKNDLGDLVYKIKESIMGIFAQPLQTVY